MPVFYDPADKEVHNQVEAVIKKYHPELVEAKVNVAVMFAFAARNEAGETEANPIMVGGFMRPAKIRVVSLKDRAKNEKNGDVELLIDQDNWKDATEPERDAIIDGQLERLELKRDSEKAVKLDDRGRPMLKLKPFDYCLTGFVKVAQRHADASTEVVEAKAFFDKNGQAYFGWLPYGDSESKRAHFPDAADQALASLVGGNGENKSDAAPEPTGDGKPARKGRGGGKRTKDVTFVDAKTREPVKKHKLPDAGDAASEGSSVSKEWGDAQRPPTAIAN